MWWGTLDNIFLLITTAVIWGVTNAFMKIGVRGLEGVHQTSYSSQIIAELLHLLKNWKYMVPFLFNQLGSILFYFAISKNELSLAVPVVNSLTLVITLMTGSCLGERINKGLVCGVLLVLTGVSLCIYEKANHVP